MRMAKRAGLTTIHVVAWGQLEQRHCGPNLFGDGLFFKASGIRCHYKHFPGFEFFRSQAESRSASGLVTFTVDIPYSNIYNESTQKWKDSAPGIRKFFH